MRHTLAATNLIPLVLGFLLAGCGEPALGPGPAGLTVSASLSAVSLADDCDARGAGADFAPCESGDNCPSLCQQSNLQIELSSDDGGTSSVSFEVIAVRVLGSTTRNPVDTLVARDPERWVANNYVVWDQKIAPSSILKVSYRLSAADFSTETEDASLVAETYLVEVDVRIDGVLRTLSLDGVTREPDVAT